MFTDDLIMFGFIFLTTSMFLLSVAGVILLRPVSKHLGQYLEAKAEQGRALPGYSQADMERMFSLMEGVADRLERLEEKQDFTDNLLTKPQSEKAGD